MKKILAILLTGVLLFSFSACNSGGNQEQPVESVPLPSVSEEQTESSAASDGSSDQDRSEETKPVDKSSIPVADAGQELPPSQSSRVLVAYFSHTGNTSSVATRIVELTGADSFEIRATYEYPSAYNDVLEVAREERSSDARPELNGTVEHIENYDVVLIGYPIWHGDMPMAVYSFLEAYDLSGKTILPFCTHGGSGLSGTVGSIASAQPDAVVLDGLAVRDANAGGVENDIAGWLNNTELFD